jgi:pimeloyl-ACP methyl ester carboxylesterase
MRVASHRSEVLVTSRGVVGAPDHLDGLPEDASALLEALDVPTAHAMGWSLGSAVVQELALAHPQQVASAVLYATWGRCDGFQRAVLSALRLPYAVRDMEAALAVSGLAFSPELLDRPDLGQLLEPMLPAFPQTEAQMAATVEQWDADLALDTLDRLGGIEAPTTPRLVVLVRAGATFVNGKLVERPDEHAPDREPAVKVIPIASRSIATRCRSATPTRRAQSVARGSSCTST